MPRLLILCLTISAILHTAEVQSSAGNRIEDNCYQCHQSRFEAGSSGHPGTDNNGCACCHCWTMGSPNLHNVSRPSNADCIGCHNNSSDYRINAAHQSFDCVTCHSPHSSDQQHLLSKNSNVLCTEQCHTMHELGRSHPRGPGTLDCNTESEITCTSSCHSIHTTYPDNLLSSPTPELCARCHPDKF